MKPVSRWPETVRRKTGSPAPKRALPPEMNDCVVAGSTCATSSRQASSAASELRAFAVTGERAVLAEHGDADRAGVEPLRVRADDVPLDAAVPALVDGAETVDEEVVADVVPAVALHVVELDRLDDRRRLGGRVAVRAGRVVDDSDTQSRGERRPGAPDLLVRVPAAARHDRGCFRPLQRPRRHARVRARDEPGAQTAHASARAGTRSGRTGRPTTGCRAASRSSGRARAVRASGRSSASGAASSHALQRPRDRARPELHRPGAAPVDADEIEAGRRASPRTACARPRAARRARRSSPPARKRAPAGRGRVR